MTGDSPSPYMRHVMKSYVMIGKLTISIFKSGWWPVTNYNFNLYWAN